jgi:hypothetical protein
MDHDLLAQLGAAAGVLGSVLLFVARTRSAFLTGLVLLVVAAAGLEGSLSNRVSLERLTSPSAIAAGALAVVALVLGAAFFLRWPAALIPIAAAAAPFRPPLDFGQSHRFLVAVATDGRIGRLLPLYLVLGTAALAAAIRVARDGKVAALPSELAYPAAFFTGLVGVSLWWSYDLSAGRDLLLFFLFPMVLLVSLIGRSPVQPWLGRSLYYVTVAIAGLFAAVGLWEAYTKELIFATPRIEIGNVYQSFFRVTSLFNDPSLYGRHVVVGITVVLVAMWALRVSVWISAALVAFLFAGLYFSYSQSSMTALAVTAVAVVLMLGDRMSKRVVLATAIVIALIGATGVAASVHGQSVKRVTSDRSRRVDVTAKVFFRHPLVGVGIGGHPQASVEISKRPLPKADYVSHTTPLTIAAELGIVGLVAYAALLGGAIVLFVRTRRIDMTLGVGLGAVFLALFVHSLFYGGFFEDPMSWLALAIAAAVLVAARGAPAPASPAAPDEA